MSCDLIANGAFKRMSGLWLPSDARDYYTRNQYIQHDRIFRKKEALPVIEQVGGGEAGQAPSESARILFWGNDHGCKMCDMNFASVAIGVGCANAGKIVLTTSPKDDFSEGYFVAVEAIAEQVTVDALTSGTWGYSGSYFTYGSMPGYATDRAYKREYTAAAINESSTYINTPWPSANIIDYAVNFQGYIPPQYSLYYSTYAENAISTMPNLAGYYIDRISTLGRMRGGGNGTQNDGSQKLTFTKYTVTCGTVSGGSNSTLSTRAVWSGLDVNSRERSSIWIGIAEGFIKTGLGRHVFMPSMPISQLKQDQWRQGETYWKVDATPGTLVVVDAAATATTQLTAGLSALSAYGMKCLGTAVTQSPKSRSLRSSLVSSPLGLVWGNNLVFPGINEAHTTKASKWPETVWPMEQPEQPVSLSIGAAKAKPTSLTVKFQTTTNVTGSYNSPETDAVITTDLLDKPIATIQPIVVDDETGRIGRNFVGNFFAEGITAINYRETPQRTEWQGVFDYELQRIEDTKTPRPNDFQTSALPYIDNGNYWYSNSDQTQQWKTRKTDEHSFTVESIQPHINPKAFWDGEYTVTNTTPDGTQSAEDFFYASPDRSADVLEAVPTMSLPAFANRSVADSKAYLWNKPNNFLYNFTRATYPISDLSQNIPSLAPYEENNGVVIRTASGALDIDPSFQKQFIGFGGWDDVSATHNVSATKFSVDVVKQRTQMMRQVVLFSTAVAEGWAAYSSPTSLVGPFNGYPTPKSEFYKADYSRLDDLNERLCSVAKLAMIKSCRWIPKQTQMFCLLRRYQASGDARYLYSLPGGWGYYGGVVPDKDVLDMLDQYSTTNRGKVEPSGGEVLVILRRTWQIELTIVSGNPTYTPCEVIADNLQRYNAILSSNYGGPVLAQTTFVGTRQVKFTVSFDIDQAESVTHKMNHESSSSVAFPMTEQQFTDFENGQEMSFPVAYGGYFGSESRYWGSYQGGWGVYARQATTAKIKLN
jgi:hypothetical protein